MGWMGLCHEFGAQIRADCEHPMRAGASACSCAECGVVCRGLFDGCPAVWERGPRPVTISATRAAATTGSPTATATGSRAEARSARPVTAPAAIGPAPADRAGDERSADERLNDGAADRPIGDRPGYGDRAAGDRAAGDRPGYGDRAAGDRPSYGDRAAGDRAAGDRAAGDRAGAGHRSEQASPGDNRSAKSDGGGEQSAGDPRQEVFRWFEEAFEGVRGELQTLIGSMTHQQAMLAELLDSRQAELRLALVAESLPDIVADAIRSAMDEHTAVMAQSFDRSHDRFLDDVDQIRVATAETVESLNESFRKLAGTIAVHDEEAEQREAVRLGVIKGSVTRQVTPLAEALADLGAKIDALRAKAAGSGRSTAASWAQPPGAAPAPATPKGLVASRTAARGAHPAVGKRLSSARMSRVEEVDDDPPVVPKRVSTARVAVPRVAVPRVAVPRVATGGGSNGAASPAAAKRVSTARVASAASPPTARRVSTARTSAAVPAGGQAGVHRAGGKGRPRARGSFRDGPRPPGAHPAYATGGRAAGRGAARRLRAREPPRRRRPGRLDG